MNIIILTKTDQIKKNVFEISDNRFIHIKDILKSKAGNILEIGLLNGPTGYGEIIKIDSLSAIIKIIELVELNNFEFRIDIILALPRPQTLKKVLNTAATMGVDNIYLIKSAKVEKSYFQSPLLKKENYTKYLIEGLSQGKRTRLPNISIHKRFKQFIEHYFPIEYNQPVKLLAHTGEEQFLNQLDLHKSKNFTIAIGPEGGWNDFEVSFMVQNGFQKFKLSNNILRVETALTAALAQLEMISSEG